MAKVVHHLRPRQMEFQKIFSKLCNTKSAWQVWSDFVELTACAISIQVDFRQRKKREETYTTIINGYTESERALFPDMLGVLCLALEENQEQDFLGEMFMALELGSHWHGQFFTPYNVCAMMARVSTEHAKEKLAEKGYVVVNDPACGAGATLIAARNALQSAGIGGNQAWFVGQDISHTAGLMCYIQLSLLGCAGYVVIADSLLYPVTGPLLAPNITPEQDAWYMPMNYLEPTWVLRSMGRTWPKTTIDAPTCHEKVTPQEANCLEKVTVAEAEHHEPEQKKGPSASDIPLTEVESGQLTLF